MSLKTYRIQGIASYAKVLGAAPPGYDNGPAEWTVDVVLDEQGKKDFLASGADQFYIKTDKEGREFVRFTRKAIKKNGEEAKPIQVVGPDGKDWDQKTLIGNGSVLNVKFALNEIEHKKQKRLKPSVLGIQVWEHVPYKAKSDFPIKESSNITEQGAEAW
jgi:hypothetical protein